MTNAWTGNWYERTKKRIRERGFETATAFANSRPTASLVTLARDLAGDRRDIAAVQLQKVLIDEAEAAGTIERCARSLMLRELHRHLPEGWRTEWDENSIMRLGAVYGGVYAALPERYKQPYRRARNALEAAPIPVGWLPAGPDDPILLEAFRHWHDSPSTDG